MTKIILIIAIVLFPTLLFAQQTYVPDNNFEQALIDFGYDSGALDDYVPTANIENVEVLSLPELGIRDMRGIEDFAALKQLSCAYNQLFGLNISNNSNLELLDCGNNQLKNLDLSANIALKILNCSENDLELLNLDKNINLEFLNCSVNLIKDLDLSKNIVLTDLYCSFNEFRTIDISTNTLLRRFDCSNNLLDGLDMSNNIAITSLLCFENNLVMLNMSNGNNSIISKFQVYNNSELFCIQVDDSAAAANRKGWEKDAHSFYSDNCGYSPSQKTYVPDDNFEQALIDLGYDEGELNDSIPTVNIEIVTELNVDDKDISNLTGIQDFIALEILSCSNNNLISIDVSNSLNLLELNCDNNKLVNLNLNKNKSLKLLDCNNNNLIDLNIRNNTKLIEIYCFDNQLTIVDVSRMYSLKRLLCANNNLIKLNINNGRNDNINGDTYNIYFDATMNPDLTCIQVDDSAASVDYDKWSKDDHAVYSENCGFTSVKEYLLNTDISVFPNPASSTFVVRFGVKSPQAVTLSLSDLSGNVLQEFSLLNTLNVNKEIDISKLPSGVYFLNIGIGNETVSKKIVVE